MLKRYDGVMQEQLKCGIIVKVDPWTTKGMLKHYIPHHAVITPQKTTTKICIVYDGLSKTKRENKSLNECVLQGPVILEDLCGLLLRFRTHKIGLASDIEKAFLQVGLQEMEFDITQFLWLKDLNIPQAESNIQIPPFGAVSSPFLLGATILYHFKKKETEVAKKIERDICMNNVITGENSTKKLWHFTMKPN